jgi:DNA-binding YbaB/EbfC family protein
VAKGIGNIMKQAQKLQSEMKRIQDELAEKTVEATAGGGMVTVIANGKQEIVSIKIDPEVVDKEDVEMLEDLIVAAVNEAKRRSQEMMMGEISKVTGGLGIPPGLLG